tara:strand:+ start:119 stop:331 length:213 start_codon:yes stop_codon:yes gene_type:complete
MDNKIIDKVLNFIEKDLIPPIKKDFTCLSKAISKDIKKLTKDKRQSKKNKNKYFITDLFFKITHIRLSPL